MVSAATRFQARLTDPLLDDRIPALLGASAAAVAHAWGRATSPASEAEPAEALRLLTDAIVCGLRGEPLRSLGSLVSTVEAPRLLAALRREVLAREPGADLPSEQVLDILRQIEHLSEAFESDAPAHFAEQVLGANALQLLVEVAHDMRSPLGSIQFLVERMRRGQSGPVSPLQERHLGLVFSAAFGLSAMASDMMELAQGGARLVGPAVVPFKLSEVLHAVRDVIQPIAEEKGLTVRFSGPPGDVRLGHPAALHRVLLNLVTNALKFTNTGSVTVQAESLAGGRVRFLVADTGRGMPASVTARLTEGLGRIHDGDAASVFSSAGLGLAICQKLVDAMGGRLSILSADESGTRLDFSLRLPDVTDA